MSFKDRTDLHFARKVRGAFLFLEEMGFTVVEATSTLVRYRKDDIEVDVYHGRQSYEVGAGVTAFGVRYSMSEIIRTADAAAAQIYRSPVATTPEGIADGLEELSSLMKGYGGVALKGDRQFFSKLAKQREQWSEDYALDVMAGQLRPRAEEAFRRGNYAMAAELYARIKGRLSPAEAKKLAVARSRSSG
ncbi:MAG: hypothetical protein KIS83_08170 [Rubrivivax sp.]|nr:hypothetical protein [Rubrivivax sp.]